MGGLVGLLALDLELASLVSYWGTRLAFAGFSALLGALVWPTRLRFLAGTAAAGLSLLWLAAAFTPLCPWLANGLVRREPLQPADAVFVFSADVQRDGEPTGATFSRLVHGLELVGQGYAPRLVISELRSPSSSYAPFARRLMTHLRLEGELILVGPVTNTREEAVAVAALVKQRGWQRVLAVTSPTHSRRATACLERAGVSAVSSPAVETRFDVETFWLPEDRLRSFGSLLHERVGLWVYARRGWITSP